MVTGDGAYIKKFNRSIILEKIIEHGTISRADLAKITGLNKATISVQVADLIHEQLILETQHEHNTIGRRPIMLSINNTAGYVLGIDLDYGQILFTLTDLQGHPIYSHVEAVKTGNYDEIVQLLIDSINTCKDKCTDSHYGLVSIIIGIHGTVNTDESIYFVPKYQWHNKQLKTDLEKHIDIPIHIENNANLSAYAENVYHYPECNHLLTILLSSGIGAGMIMDGVLHKGYHGYAGEMGHMIIYPDGERCRCGNLGCWEKYASEPSLLAKLAKSTGKELTMSDVKAAIVAEDPTILSVLEQYIVDLSIGLNNIINIYNPETLVINSDLLQHYPQAVDKIKQQLTSSVSQYREIVLSKLGERSSIMGACALAIQQFFEINTLFLSPSETLSLLS